MIIHMLFSLLRLHRIQNIEQTKEKTKNETLDENLVFQKNR